MNSEPRKFARALAAGVGGLVLLLAPVHAGATPIAVNGVRYQAIMVAPNYPGGPAFDDNLALSRAALASAFATWPNWRRGLGGNIVELPGNTNRTAFLNAFAPFIAGGSEALQAGDLFVLFYFGHGSYYQDSETPPALNPYDEGLAFPSSKVLDDDMRAKFGQFNPGVFKLFIDVSCFSGGMWNGYDAVGGGDLEQEPRSILMSSSRENQFTFVGGVLRRWWEPIFLVKLINTALTFDHTQTLSIANYYALSAASGSAVNASRFAEGDPGENPPPGDALWEITASGDFDSEFEANVSFGEMPDLFPAPAETCATTATSTSTTTTCPPFSFLVRTDGKVGNEIGRASCRDRV